ncbi:hypothetical protein ABLV90_03115 [Staphylococcus sp. 2S1]
MMMVIGMLLPILVVGFIVMSVLEEKKEIAKNNILSIGKKH